MERNKERCDGYRPVPTVEDNSVTGTTSVKPNIKFLFLWRGINLIMTIFFLLAAYVQINDPDPYIWIPAYVIPALLTFGIVINPSITGSRIWQISCGIALGISVLGGLYLIAIIVEVLGQKFVNPLEHEEGRELGGVVIILFWLGMCRFSSLGSSEPSKGSFNFLVLLTGVLGVFPLFFWSLCFVSDWHKKLGHCKDMFPDL